MTIEEATEIIFIESMEGLAVTTQQGQFPTHGEATPLINALDFVYKQLQNEELMNRRLAASLFVLHDQLQGNMLTAHTKGLKVPDVFSDEVFPKISDLIYAIFEDWDEDE